MRKTQREITPALLYQYTEHLQEQERSAATVEKYTPAHPAAGLCRPQP